MECYLCFEKKNCVIKCKNCNLHACSTCKETWKKKIMEFIIVHIDVILLNRNLRIYIVIHIYFY